jgi:hypothetical protein
MDPNDYGFEEDEGFNNICRSSNNVNYALMDETPDEDEQVDEVS